MTVSFSVASFSTDASYSKYPTPPDDSITRFSASSCASADVEASNAAVSPATAVSRRREEFFGRVICLSLRDPITERILTVDHDDFTARGKH
ncbi:MAG TPA: hypothetical protein VJR58_15405, partial [Vineibacter sp.]|nr:hypothetical protein [Vineibacter sp.]